MSDNYELPNKRRSSRKSSGRSSRGGDGAMVVNPLPIAQTSVAPEQNQWKLDMEESILYNGEPYMLNPPNCKEQCYMGCCCWKQWFKYTAKGNKELVYYNNCTCGPPCCTDHWHIKYVENGEKTLIGYSTGQTVGQGCCVWCKNCCCPCGERTIQNFYNADKNAVYAIRKNVTCINCCFFLCTPCGECVAVCMDCCSWCTNNNFIILKETLVTPDGKDEVGEIHQLLRVDCLCCCPQRQPIRYTVKMNDPTKHAPALVSILPMFYRGLPVICKCCSCAPAQPLTGVAMIDAGRKYTMKRGGFKSVLEAAGQPEEMEMER